MSHRTAVPELEIPGRPRNGYLPSLDGLRAIAVSLVIVHHMLLPTHFGGRVGVDIFFVLSGFLITSLLVRELSISGEIRFRQFYIRRLIRLYPPLLLAISVLAIPGFLFAPSALKYLVENLLAITYLTPFALQVSDGASWAWRHSWSLGIEEAFYLVWPLLLFLALKKMSRIMLAGALVVLGAMILAICIYFDLVGITPSLFLRTGGLFMGAALAVYLQERPESSFSATTAWLGVLFIALAVLYPIWIDLPETGVVLTVIGSLGLVAHVATNRRSVLSRWLSLSPLTYIGRISYELYLWHFPILVICGWAFRSDLRDVALIAIPLSVGLAALSHRLLVERIDIWKKSVSRGGRYRLDSRS